MQSRKKIGEILVEKGILTPKTVDRMLIVAKRHNKRLGTLLEEMEIATAEEVAEVLAVQHGAKVVNNLMKYSFPKDLLKIISPENALQYIIFPLKLEQNRLFLAMADPTDMKIVTNMAINSDLTIVPFVATRRDILAAICKHYYGREMEEPKDRTILVVDDDDSVVKMLSMLLNKHGFNTISASDGMEGFKEAISKNPHVIITDKVLPKIDGYALLASLKKLPETRSIPVLLISGQKSEQEEAIAFDKGFFDYIPKPFGEITIIARVKRALLFYDRKYELMV
ncbi:response regulator [Geobacter pelophilus]|jgi:CheY-like chemotaxis protein|uniref:Response regulator n=1 Tax=Geoanaerobacter pelophilus TaxID=60036 RepID=A0AAW4LCG1_9BACT|nr:response regulator [Geoanaerobacter pelophilus]MBT0666096.1 response regulator [Geoanaerobacter pelophilus]